MEKEKPNHPTSKPPDEFILLQQWKDYWKPSQNQQAIEKLIERIDCQFEFDQKIYKDKESKLKGISKEIIENKLNISSFPEIIPAWIEIDKNDREIHHPKQKINHYLEFSTIISESSIGALFRKYYKKIFKTRFARLFLYFSFIMLIGNLIYMTSFWSFKWSPFSNYVESNLLILLYLVIPTIYALFFTGIFCGYLKRKVKPSKWHFFDILAIVSFPTVFYLFELTSDLNLMNSFISTPPPFDLQTLIRIYSTWNSFIILIVSIATISYYIIPCTPRGRLFYFLLKLEYSIKSERLEIVKKIPKYFHEIVISLNDLLIKSFNTSIENLNEIEGTFIKNLLNKRIEDFRKDLNFSGDKGIITYFSKGINFEDDSEKNSKKKKKIKVSRNKLRDTDYLHNLNSIKIVTDKLTEVSEDLAYVRTSVKQQLRYKSQKIISIIVAIGSFILSNLIPLFL